MMNLANHKKKKYYNYCFRDVPHRYILKLPDTFVWFKEEEEDEEEEEE